jgi:cytosine/uracil/thiamine/allantoin permease
MLVALAPSSVAQILAKSSATVSHFTGFFFGFAVALILHFALRAGRSGSRG